MRRRLTKHEASLVTEKAKKKQMHFPQRNYAVKVRPKRLQTRHCYIRSADRSEGGGIEGWGYLLFSASSLALHCGLFDALLRGSAVYATKKTGVKCSSRGCSPCVTTTFRSAVMHPFQVGTATRCSE